MLMRAFHGFLALLFITFSSVCFAGHGASKEAAPAEPAEPEIGYYTINPDLTTNVATLNSRDKIHYVRAKIALMLEDSRDSAIIADVEPLIKDAIIDILGSKDFSQVATNESRERIRTECREKLLDIFKDKFGKPIIIDVLFLNYMYQ